MSVASNGIYDSHNSSPKQAHFTESMAEVSGSVTNTNGFHTSNQKEDLSTRIFLQTIFPTCREDIEKMEEEQVRLITAWKYNPSYLIGELQDWTVKRICDDASTPNSKAYLELEDQIEKASKTLSESLSPQKATNIAQRYEQRIVNEAAKNLFEQWYCDDNLLRVTQNALKLPSESPIALSILNYGSKPGHVRHNLKTWFNEEAIELITKWMRRQQKSK